MLAILCATCNVLELSYLAAAVMSAGRLTVPCWGCPPVQGSQHHPRRSPLATLAHIIMMEMGVVNMGGFWARMARMCRMDRMGLK